METQVVPFYRRVLVDELAKRLHANPRYSLRRFAHLLKVQAGPLSQMINGKRSPSIQVVNRIFAAIELSDSQRKEFVHSLVSEKKSQQKKRISPQLKKMTEGAKGPKASATRHEMDHQEFSVIADWYHLAIWEMVDRDDFKPLPSWISKRLGISPLEAKLAFERLRNLGLVILENGHWQKGKFELQTKDLTKTSFAHQRRQKQMLLKSQEALERVPIHQRHHGGITMNIDPELIPVLREKIQETLWELVKNFKTGNRNQVYEFSLQIFPVENAQKPNGGSK